MHHIKNSTCISKSLSGSIVHYVIHTIIVAVAVPDSPPQHSPMLGHLASSHTCKMSESGLEIIKYFRFYFPCFTCFEMATLKSLSYAVNKDKRVKTV